MESKTSKTTTKKTAKSAKPKKTLAETVKLVEFKPDDLAAPQFVAVEDYSKFVTKVQDWQNSILNVDVKFKMDEGVEVPKPAHPGDIGLDVYAQNMEYDLENDCYVYHTGIRCETPEGVGCFLLLRSSNAETDAYMPNSIGLIDTATYRGEIIIKLKNRTNRRIEIMTQILYAWNDLPWYKRLFKKFGNFDAQQYPGVLESFECGDWAPYGLGEKLGQLVFLKFPKVHGICVEQLSETERGEGGFGSTGK